MTPIPSNGHWIASVGHWITVTQDPRCIEATMSAGQRRTADKRARQSSSPLSYCSI